MRTPLGTLEMAAKERRPSRSRGTGPFGDPFFTFLLAALFAGACQADSGQGDWSYDGRPGHGGPLEWYKLYPTCKEKMQSPVDLKGAADAEHLGDLVLHGYDKVLENAVLVNDGYTVKLSHKVPGAWISGGCLGDQRYHFLQAHFHWGADDDRGSEHTLNGQAFPMEAHLVHRNGRYDSHNASHHEDGLAVLGVFYKVSDSGLDQAKALINALKNVGQAGIKKEVKVGSGLTLRALLPKDLGSFYCYQKGSLTTPPCDQAVTWTVLEDIAPVTTDQLSLFRQLRFVNGEKMVDNYRPYQPLNGRTIFFYSSSAPRLGSAAPSSLLLFVLSCLGFLLLPLARQEVTVPAAG